MLGKKICKICPFLDKERSKPHLGENGVIVNPQGLSFCKVKNDWVFPDTPCEGQAKNKGKRHELKCSECGKVIAEVSLTTGKNPEFYNFVYTDNLLAYRERADGLIGFECVCGNDTRLSNVGADKIIRRKSLLIENGVKVKAVKSERANWDNQVASFKLKGGK